MRPAEGHQPGSHAGGHPGGGQSATPIFDALYAEYRRSFRALPGDRSGEEDLTYRGFPPTSHGAHHHPAPHPPRWQPYPGQHGTGPGRHFPAALPPAPRREH
ncbi:MULTISPECIES: hypothetical protein [unclassified Streptomyces]|uniref:hypothetical protein n=1 Tax=unclassified Streptomyces TaxID=2593676 RepID=UPI00278C208B|nr:MULTISPECIES: hypothetical protein [unclassified Streptomyces]